MTNPVELTKKLVTIESCNPGAGEGELGNYILSRLEARGIPVLKQEVFPGRFNIIAKIDGSSQKHPVALICHMDTVVVGEGWTEAPFLAIEKNGHIYGRGACDMKSGLSCALSVFEELWEKGEKPGRTVMLIATVDEEAEMNGISAILREKLIPENSLMMDLEPTGLAIAVSHKGRIWYRVKVRGITAHASTPWKGIDAIAAAAEFISATRGLVRDLQEHSEMGAPTVTFGQINGGYQPYVVPDLCEFTMDLRTVPPYSNEDIEALMTKAKSRVEEDFPGIELTWELTGNRSYVHGNKNSELCAALFEAYRGICGRDAKLELFPGYTDTAVAAVALNNYNCVSFGPGSLEMAHKPDEYVEVKEIINCKKVLKSALEQLCFADD